MYGRKGVRNVWLSCKTVHACVQDDCGCRGYYDDDHDDDDYRVGV